MTERLLESEYLTVDLRAILNKQKNNDNKAETSAAQENNTSFEKKPSNFDWKAELENRLKQNKQLEPKDQKKDYEIEDLFWKDYFNNNWDSEIAKQLFNMGNLLRKAIITIGFDPKRNPILSFINLPYVQKNLISTSLLNINTFEAIYTALAKKQIALKEFFSDSDYNIIYCRDLYSRTSSEMQKYLSEQLKSLAFNKSSYTPEEQAANIKKFLQPGAESVKDINAKLRKLTEFNTKGKATGTSKTDKATGAKANKRLKEFTSTLESKKDFAAAFLLADAVDPGDEATKALAKLNYSPTDASEVINQIMSINSKLKQVGLEITTENVGDLISELQQQMRSIL
jgi:hypothetical protein